MKKESERQTPSCIFEGMTSVSAVINGGYRKIEKLYLDKAKKESKTKELAFLTRHGIDIEYTDSEYIDKITTGSSHGGIVAMCTERSIPAIGELEIKENGFYVMLDGIEDPYNFGYALRTIYASGADAVIVTPRNWMSAAGVVCRSSAGASELLPLYTSEPSAAVDFFEEKKIKTAAAGIRDSVNAFDADLSLPLFLVVGGEKRGISSAVLKKCSMTVRLDYGRSFRGSLSAASAASVLCYEVLRQNRGK